MSRIAHASGAAAIVVISVASINADAGRPSPAPRTCIEVQRAPANAATDPAPRVTKRQRIRSLSETIGQILDPLRVNLAALTAPAGRASGAPEDLNRYASPR